VASRLTRGENAEAKVRQGLAGAPVESCFSSGSVIPVASRFCWLSVDGGRAETYDTILIPA